MQYQQTSCLTYKGKLLNDKIKKMKRLQFRTLSVGLILSAGLTVFSCKSKPKDTGSTVDTTMSAPAPVPAAPVEISADDSLTKGAKDATKDYPGVTASVSNGEITLTGNIQRSDLPKLMESLHSLRPKKINNNLTIK